MIPPYKRNLDMFTPETVLKISGRYKMTAVKADGSGQRELAEFPNMILNQGMDYLFTTVRGNWPQSIFRKFHVGASGAPVEAGQTGLLSPIASTADLTSPVRPAVVPGDTSYTLRWSSTRRFGEGTAAGIIAEVASGWGNATTGCFNRALVRDVEGNPTTVEVLADEYLDLTWTLTMVIDTSDTFFTLNLSSGSHEGVLRPSALSSSDLTGWQLVSGINLGGVAHGYVSQGGLGLPSQGITGSKTLTTPLSVPDTYVPGSYTQTVWLTMPLVNGNLAGGFSAMSVQFSNWIGYQMSFTPSIPKTASNIFKIRLRVSLARG